MIIDTHPASLPLGTRSLLSLSLLMCLAGCDVSHLAATSTAEVYRRAGAALERQGDLVMVGDALPGLILQLEGLYEVAPDDPSIALQAGRAWASYSFGWLEDGADLARFEGNADTADQEMARAIAGYRRARDLLRAHMRLRASGFRAARLGPLSDFRQWLSATFTAPEDAESLFWAGYTWGLYINARHPSEQIRGRAFALSMVRRSVELDPHYYGGSGLAILAYAATNRPGADLDEAEAAWQRVLDTTERQNLLALWTMSQTYARRRGDGELSQRLLQEVVDAEAAPPLRILNLIAQRRAQRDLQRAQRRAAANRSPSPAGASEQ